MLEIAGWLQSQFRQPESESGQTLVEYALIILFIAIALVLALQTFAGGLIGSYEFIASQIPGGGGT
jgi:Flp pilus assembly pilin Flp